MNQNFYFIMFSVLLFGFSSCEKKCNHYDYYPPAEIMEKYFGVFDEGYSWVYTNEDKTKTDSLYLKYKPNINQGIFRATNLCYDIYERRVFLYSDFFCPDSIYCSYDASTNSKTYFSFEKFRISFIADYSEDIIYLTPPDLPAVPLIADSLRTPDNTVYHDVINYNDQLWIAPGIGLVQYLSYDKKEHFYLTKFYSK